MLYTTLGQWSGWETLRHVINWNVFGDGGCNGVAGLHPCGSILKLAGVIVALLVTP